MPRNGVQLSERRSGSPTPVASDSADAGGSEWDEVLASVVELVEGVYATVIFAGVRAPFWPRCRPLF